MHSLNTRERAGGIIVSIFISVLSISASAVDQIDPSTELIDPIVEMQELIDGLATGVTSRHPISEQEFKNGVARLSRIANADRRVILEQLLLYHGEKRLKDGSMASTLGVGVILREFNYEDSETLSITYPILQRSDAYWSDRIAHALLDGIGATDNIDSPDFTQFEQFIEKRTAAPEEELYPLYRYLFKRSPGQAVRTMQRIYGAAEGLDSNLSLLEARFGAAFRRTKNSQDISDADVAEALANLSTHTTWWVRLFTAKVLERQKDFAAPELTSRLESDSNVLVAESAKEAIRAVEKEFTR